MEPSPPPASAPTRRRARDCLGQASIDYAALLAVVAIALAGAGAAAGGGLEEIPRQVAHGVRTGLCIVGGDICRPSDAIAAGLSPCVVAEHAHGSGLTLSIAVFRIGESGEWSAARRSDGTVLVTHSDDRRVGAGAGVGFELGGLELGADGSVDLTAATGEAWELPSTAAAARLLDTVKAGRPSTPPDFRFGDAGQEANGWLGVHAFGMDVTGLEASWRTAAGVRVGRDEQTVYVHASAAVTGAVAGLLDLGSSARGSSTAPGGGRTGPLLIAVTRNAQGLEEIAFRRVTPGASKNETVEVLARLDLRDPTNRAITERLLRVRAPWPPSVARDLRAVVERTRTAGTIERDVYAVDDRSHEVAGAVHLALELGLEASSVDVTRRLVAASAWTRGSPERRRADCTGEGAAVSA